MRSVQHLQHYPQDTNVSLNVEGTCTGRKKVNEFFYCILYYIIVELEILHVRRPFLHLVFVLSEGAHLTFRMHYYFGCIRC